MTPPVAVETHDVLAAGWDLYRACANIEAEFDPADPGGSARRILPLILPNCSADSVDVEQVLGGITNTLFKCSFPQLLPDEDAVQHEGGARRSVLVRIFGENGVDRDKDSALFASYVPPPALEFLRAREPFEPYTSVSASEQHAATSTIFTHLVS